MFPGDMPDFADDAPEGFEGLCLMKVGAGLCASDAAWHIIRRDGSGTEVCEEHLDAARWQADYRHSLTPACLNPRSGFVAEWNVCVVTSRGRAPWPP